MSEALQPPKLQRVEVPPLAPIIYPRHFGTPLPFELSAHFPEVSELVDAFAAELEKRSPHQRSGVRLFFSEGQGAFGLNTFLPATVEVSVEENMSADEIKLAALLLAKKDVGGIGVTSRSLERCGRVLETCSKLFFSSHGVKKLW